MSTHGSYGHDEQHDVSDLVRSMALSSARLWEEVFERLRRLEVAQGELRDMLGRLENALPPGSAPIAAVGPASPALGLGSWEGVTGQDPGGPAHDAETDLFSGPATSMDAVDLLVGGVDGASARSMAPFADDVVAGRQAPGEDTPVRFPFPPADDATADLLSGGADPYGSPTPARTGWAPEPPPPPGTWVPVPASVNGDDAALQEDAVFAAADGGAGAVAHTPHEEPSAPPWDVPPYSPSEGSEETATAVRFGRHAAAAPSASQADDDLRTIEPMPFELPGRISGAIADDAADVLAIGEGNVPPPPPGFTIIGADQPAPPLAFEANEPESGLAPPPPPPPGFGFAAEPTESPPPPPPGFGIHALETGLTAPPPPGFEPPPPPPGFRFAAEPAGAPPTPPPGFEPPPPPPPGFGFGPDTADQPPPPPTGFGSAAEPTDAPPPPPPPGFGFSLEPTDAPPPPPPPGFGFGPDTADQPPPGFGFSLEPADQPPPPPPGFEPPPPGAGLGASPDHDADAPPGFRIQAAAVPPNGPAGFSPGDFGADGPFGSGRHDREQAHQQGSDEDETPPPITPDFFARAGRRRR